MFVIHVYIYIVPVFFQRVRRMTFLTFIVTSVTWCMTFPSLVKSARSPTRSNSHTRYIYTNVLLFEVLENHWCWFYASHPQIYNKLRNLISSLYIKLNSGNYNIYHWSTSSKILATNKNWPQPSEPREFFHMWITFRKWEVGLNII